MQDKNTELMEEEIKNATEYDNFVKENHDVMDNIHPGLYISQLIEKSGMKKSKVLAGININTGYAYEILRQEKMPDRDKALQFAFALSLNIADTQQMLKKCGYAKLYVKHPRDAVIYYCISRRQTLIDTNILLDSQGFDIL